MWITLWMCRSNLKHGKPRAVCWRKGKRMFRIRYAPNANRQNENNGNESDRSKLGSIVPAHVAASF